MASDDETNDSHKQLDHREQFPGWKSRMSLLAMAKGDTDGIFTDRGNDPNVGYQTRYPQTESMWEDSISNRYSERFRMFSLDHTFISIFGLV